MISFTPAVRSATKSRIALIGPSGSGKTYTALTLATTLSDSVGVIDTERGSAAKYVGLNGWQFETYVPQAFSPQSLIDVLGVASGSGFGCLVIDSLSHYWSGTDGMLEQVDLRTKGNSSFGTGWKDMRPIERRMIDALVSYPGHLIVTLRTKTEYAVEKDEKGKNKPVKIGLKPEQRDGLEYEFDLVGDMDQSNTLTVSKSRIPALTGALIPQPGSDLAATIKEWLEDGVDRPGPLQYRAKVLQLDDAAALKSLFDEVSATGLINAPVVDEVNQPMSLGDLIKACARRVTTRTAAPVVNGAGPAARPALATAPAPSETAADPEQSPTTATVPDEVALVAIAQILEDAESADKPKWTKLWKEAADGGWLDVPFNNATPRARLTEIGKKFTNGQRVGAAA